jgi:hypothetical protein
MKNWALMQGFSLVSCKYDVTDQEMLMSRILDDTEGAFRASQAEEAEGTDHTHRPTQMFVQLFYSIASRVKSRFYSEEREWRLVSYPILPGSPRLKYRSDRGALKPFIEMVVDHSVISKLVLSPVADPEKSQLRLQAAKGLCGYSVDVRNSDIPFRDW